MNNVPRVSPVERVFGASSDSLEKQMRLRAGQKHVERIMDEVSMFRKAEQLELNNCAGTLVASKACFQLPVRRNFVRYEKDSMCCQDSPPSLVNIYAKQVLSPQPDRAGSGEAFEARGQWQPSHQVDECVAGLCRTDLFLCRPSHLI